MYCRFCGNKLDEDSVFCPKCGRKLQKRRRIRKKLFIFCSSMIMICSIVVALYFFIRTNFIHRNSSDNKVTENFALEGNQIYSSLGTTSHIVFERNAGFEYFDNELLILVSTANCEDQIQKLIRNDNGTIVGQNPYINSYQVRFSISRTYDELQKIIDSYCRESYIDNVFLNRVMRFEKTYYPVSDQAGDLWKNEWNEIPQGGNWGYEAIHAPQAWDYLDSMAEVQVGVFDEGYDVNHADLKDVIVASQVNETENIDHGTHVSGIIAADFDNEDGIVGIAPTAELSVIDIGGAAENYTSTDWFGCAYSWLIGERKCKVINMSLGTTILQATASYGNVVAQEELKVESLYLEIVLKKLREQGNDFTIFVSAGNQDRQYIEDKGAPYGYYMIEYDKEKKEYFYNVVKKNKAGQELETERKAVSMWTFLREGNEDAVWNPVALIQDPDLEDRIIVVGNAQNEGDNEYSLNKTSISGDRVDIIAPGTDIYSTISNDNYGLKTGTSMAAPCAAGIGALLYSLKPDLNGAEVKRIILETANIPVTGSNRNMVNAEAAVKYLLEKYPGGLSGRVCEKDSGEIISNVELEAIRHSDGKAVRGQSNENGVFNVELEAGIYTIYFSKEGYEEIYEENVPVQSGLTFELLDSIELTRVNETEVENQKDYARYRQLILEYEEKYGKVNVDQPNEWRTYLIGLCFAKLVDFNKDGQEELLLVYSEKDAQAAQDGYLAYKYRFEIWEFQNDGIVMIDTGNLYGTNGGVQTVRLVDYNNQTYLLTGAADGFEYNYYHGYTNDEFKIVREAFNEDLYGSNGLITINGAAVEREEWIREEELWQTDCEYYTLNSDDESANRAKDVLELTKRKLGIDTESEDTLDFLPSDKGDECKLLQAYYRKYKELESQYGTAGLEESTDNNGYSYLKGLCIVDLLDFNGDGLEDLFLVYSNGQYTGTNSDDVKIPQATTYQIEVWTYLNEELVLLLNETQVGCYYSFKTEYWDSDCCYITVYENENGNPVIQIYEGQPFGDEGCRYVNIYCDDGEIKRDTLRYVNSLFFMNDETISQEIWEMKVADYKKILLCSYLSSSTWNSTGLLDDEGIHYDDTLTQTRKVVDALAFSENAEYTSVEASYLPFYLNEMDKANREYLDMRIQSEYYDIPYSYAVYDIDANGVPELLILRGSCEADYVYNIYTVVADQIIECGEFGGGHMVFYCNGEKDLIGYRAHMGAYDISKYFLEGTVVSMQTIESGGDGYNADYPELADIGYGDFESFLPKCSLPVPILLYSSGLR